MQIQAIEFGLNDKIQIQPKKPERKILYSFTPSDMNFQTIFMPKVIRPNLIFKSALGKLKLNKGSFETSSDFPGGFLRKISNLI